MPIDMTLWNTVHEHKAAVVRALVLKFDPSQRSEFPIYTLDASAPIAINTSRIGNGAMPVVLCALVSLLTAGPLSCGMGAASGGGGRCKPTKDRRVCEQLGGV
jgi:hypothetical protein